MTFDTAAIVDWIFANKWWFVAGSAFVVSFVLFKFLNPK